MKRNRKRIHRKGMFVESTDMYGPIVDSYQPIGVLREPLEMIDQIPVVKMTRKEFESSNIFAKMIGDVELCFPNVSLSKRSKIYTAVRNEFYRLLYINRKALMEQGSSLEVA